MMVQPSYNRPVRHNDNMSPGTVAFKLPFELLETVDELPVLLHMAGRLRVIELFHIPFFVAKMFDDIISQKSNGFTDYFLPSALVASFQLLIDFSKQLFMLVINLQYTHRQIFRPLNGHP